MENIFELFGPPISVYTKEDAVADGTQACIGSIENEKVYITSNLLYDGFEDEIIRN